MDVEVTGQPLEAVDADLQVVGLMQGEELDSAYSDLPGARDVRSGFRKHTLLRPDGDRRVLVIGLGKREELDAERLRIAAAVSVQQAVNYEARSVAWTLPDADGTAADPAAFAAGIADGAVLASFRFDRFKSRDPDDPPPPAIECLLISAPDDADSIQDAVTTAHVAAEAANRARELQALPANFVTPTYLANRAREIADAYDSVEVEVLGRDEITQRGMGGLAAVAKGSEQEPQLISLRYSGGPSDGEKLGLVGKAVTFDTGGISIKPSARMEEMKMDMSGGAAVLEAVAAIAELGVPVNVVACVPSAENMPSGTATRPGDIITQLNGKTVEVTNTDAEGRLILADALTYCVRELGANRLVDIATLTGGVLIALGTTYAGLLANEDEWAERITAAGGRTGEIVWRLPLHPEFRELIDGKDSDLVNTSSKRKASTIYAAEFLQEFTDDVPWAHLDIAGTAWDVGRAYVGNGPTGFGVRLFVDLVTASTE
ncbi:MAG: leucyl aminopeptidase [Actinobacteria bacterium]|nr:MAG: leucyl aminopeptidase [Actinomycetota bacterium]